jgi:hypothetical protein
MYSQSQYVRDTKPQPSGNEPKLHNVRNTSLWLGTDVMTAIWTPQRVHRLRVDDRVIGLRISNSTSIYSAHNGQETAQPCVQFIIGALHWRPSDVGAALTTSLKSVLRMRGAAIILRIVRLHGVPLHETHRTFSTLTGKNKIKKTLLL